MTITSLASRTSRIALAGIIAAAFTAAAICATAPSAHAATTFSKRIMHNSTSYSSKKYDITGDKKADKLVIKSHAKSSYENDKLYVYINGKKKLTLKSHLKADAYLFRIKSGRTFLYIKTCTYNSDAVKEGVWVYKKGKLVKVLNTYIWPQSYNKKYQPYHENAVISHSGVANFDKKKAITVKGNTVNIKFYNMTSVAGIMHETFSFKYKGGKLKRTSSTTTKVEPAYTTSKTLTAATGFNIYGKSDSTGGLNYVSYGTTLTMQAVQIRPSDHFVAVKVKTSTGATGWITYKSFAGKSSSSLHYGTLFQETGMAG